MNSSKKSLPEVVREPLKKMCAVDQAPAETCDASHHDYGSAEHQNVKTPHPKKLGQLNVLSNKENNSPGNNVLTPKPSRGSGKGIKDSLNSSDDGLLMLDYDPNESSQILPSPSSMISNKSLSESSIEDKDDGSDFDVSEFLQEVQELKEEILVLQGVLEEGERKELAQNALIKSLQKENDMLKNTLGLKRCSKCEVDLNSS